MNQHESTRQEFWVPVPGGEAHERLLCREVREGDSPITALVEALNNDPSYRASWLANIAMAVKDEWQRSVDHGGLPATPEHIHEIANRAAVYFINQLCADRSPEGTLEPVAVSKEKCPPHDWTRDGEQCSKCGIKDWMT